MTADAIVIAITRALTQAGIPHMTVGAIAGIYYGIGRTTNDADFVIQADDLRLTPLRAALGPGFAIDPQPRIESITGGTYYVVSHAESDFDIDLFILGSGAHDQMAFSRRRVIRFEAGEASICSPEDYVVTKLLWAKSKLRPKDLEDARSVLAVQKGKVDYTYIMHWCKENGTADLLDRLLKALENLP